MIALAKDSPAITAALRAVPLFARLTESQAALLAATGVRRKVLAGEVVFRESQSPDGLHVVLEGRLRIYKRAEDDTEVDLSTAGPGDTYGEMALLDDGVRSASVVALEPTELLVLGREPFLRLLSESSPGLHRSWPCSREPCATPASGCFAKSSSSVRSRPRWRRKSTARWP